MDYSRFRFRAVVDWIELEIHTAKLTNFPKVQRTLRDVFGLPEGKTPYVQPLNEGAGGAATVYRFKIHDPKNWHEVTETLQELAQTFSFAELPRVTAIEIALDAYSKGETNQKELAELTAGYYRNMTQPVSSNRRLYRDYRGSPQSMHIRPPALIRHIEEGWQISIGYTTDNHYQHAYLKTTDNNGQALPEAQYRARIEITMREKAGPCQPQEEWSAYDFTEVSQFFKFRKPKEEPDAFMQMALEATSQVGEKKQRKRKEGGTRLYSKSTVADAVLNRKAYDALRDLSRRWK